MGKVTTNVQLPYPEQNEIADVPKDIERLAVATDKLFNDWYSPTEQDVRYQKKILITASLPATGTEGDIVFLVQ
jgi:hypothetical protein